MKKTRLVGRGCFLLLIFKYQSKILFDEGEPRCLILNTIVSLLSSLNNLNYFSYNGNQSI